MWYWLLYLVLALWVLYDASQRKNHKIWWPVAVFLIGPLSLPVYFAKRNLKAGEVREGGTGWNILKNFALLWTLTMLVITIGGMAGAGEVVSNATNDAEKAGAVIGAGIGMAMLGALWFFPMLFALILGFFLKKSSVVEKGPTGKLASQEVTV